MIYFILHAILLKLLDRACGSARRLSGAFVRGFDCCKRRRTVGRNSVARESIDEVC